MWWLLLAFSLVALFGSCVIIFRLYIDIVVIYFVHTMAYRRITFEDDDEEIEIIVQLQRRPRIFKQRVNYSELYDDVDFIDGFRQFERFYIYKRL